MNGFLIPMVMATSLGGEIIHPPMHSTTFGIKMHRGTNPGTHSQIHEPNPSDLKIGGEACDKFSATNAKSNPT